MSAEPGVAKPGTWLSLCSMLGNRVHKLTLHQVPLELRRNHHAWARPAHSEQLTLRLAGADASETEPAIVISSTLNADGLGLQLRRRGHGTTADFYKALACLSLEDVAPTDMDTPTNLLLALLGMITPEMLQELAYVS